jgi:hypothetical protein
MPAVRLVTMSTVPRVGPGSLLFSITSDIYASNTPGTIILVRIPQSQTYSEAHSKHQRWGPISFRCGGKPFPVSCSMPLQRDILHEHVLHVM